MKNITRRDFAKSAGVAAAVAATGLTNSSAAANEESPVSSKDPIMVNHEWGALKEVVVGACNVRIPTKIAASSRNFLPETSIAFMEKNAGKRLQEFDPDLNAQFVEQVDAIIKILKDRGVIVHQLNG